VPARRGRCSFTLRTAPASVARSAVSRRG
jgi:hypothetical protein